MVEKRHFDAWGSLKNLEQNGTVRNITATNIYDVNLLLDRGYTGHEHLFKAGLIHMNGRLYDPLMHRFLQPDNYVQDPSNTQNYNRYSYVLNNPLKYTDPSGEEFITAFVISLVVAAATYTVSVLTGPSVWSWNGFFQSIIMAGLSSGITFGIGSGIEAVTSNLWVQTAIAPIIHGSFQGLMSEAQGGKFINGFASGAISSLAIKLLAGNNPTNDTLSGGGRCFEGGAAALGITNNEVKTVLYGAVGGAIGAAVTKGNIWEGAIIGATIASFNDLMHGKYAKKYKFYTMLDTEGARGAGHEAQSGELNNGKLRFQSKNGTLDPNDANFSGPSWFTDEIFDSVEAIQKYYGTEITPGHSFDKIDVYKMTRKQMDRAFKAGSDFGKKDYHLFYSNCTQMVTASLWKAYGFPFFNSPIPKQNHENHRSNYSNKIWSLNIQNK